MDCHVYHYKHSPIFSRKVTLVSFLEAWMPQKCTLGCFWVQFVLLLLWDVYEACTHKYFRWNRKQWSTWTQDFIGPFSPKFFYGTQFIKKADVNTPFVQNDFGTFISIRRAVVSCHFQQMSVLTFNNSILLWFYTHDVCDSFPLSDRFDRVFIILWLTLNVCRTSFFDFMRYTHVHLLASSMKDHK